MTSERQYLLAIDQGTTSSRAIIFLDTGEVVDMAQKEISLICPRAGWVEQNPIEIIESVKFVIGQVLSRNPDLKIAGAGITNQRETTILWNRRTGQPVYNAIVWQDRRTSDYCERLKSQGVEHDVVSETGLLLDPYFSATKIRWILDNVDNVAQQVQNGDILFGTPDSYVLWHLTGGRVHATDVTNASRTLLYNIKGQNWSKNLLNLFDINENILPNVCENIFEFSQNMILDSSLNVRIGGVAGDQQAALIGQGCLKAGMSKSTYGTGCFALMNVGEVFKPSQHRLLTTTAYKVGGKVSYAIEGSIFNAGTAIQFLRDQFGFFEKSAQSEKMAISVSDNGGVYFVPSFTGLGAPYWNANARGMIYGLSRDTSKAHVVRAALEAQAYQTRDLMSAMEADSGYSIDVLRVDGGLVANGFMCQFLSDILQKRIEVPEHQEATAWGAACLAGVHAGVFSSLETVSANWKSACFYEPRITQKDADDLYARWRDVVDRVNF